ncbi:MAG: hypothetical protein HY943_16720 [Gammaproteobacteria bacterium]|nr:hypothetical protein [Gammaproteobacteria bacterium]
MSTNEKDVKKGVGSKGKKATPKQDEWIQKHLDVQLDMAHGWREMMDWGADAKALIAAFDDLRAALPGLAKIDSALAAHRERIKKAFDTLTGARITNDKAIREEKQREIEALLADLGALQAATALLAKFDAPAYAVPAEANDKESAAITQALAALRKKLVATPTPEVVTKADGELAAIATLVTRTTKIVADRKAWAARHAVVEKTYKAAQAGFEPAVSAKITGWWQAVSGDAAALDYVQALAGVNVMDQVLAQLPKTQAAAKAARGQQTLAAKALDASVVTPLKKDLDAAELLLTKLDEAATGVTKLTEAAAAFATVSKAYTTALVKLAKAHETTDGGHSLDRHGPEITDDLLKRRVEKGLAADGVLSPTHSSTKFDKVEDWLETRDAAIKKILADNGVTATSLPPAVGTSYQGVLEHNKPIDSGFIADKTTASEKPMTDASGDPVYETKKGKKRWVRNDKSEPLAADGSVLPCGGAEKNPLDENGAPVAADDHATAKWKKGAKTPVLRVKTFTVYSGHTKVSGLTRTLTTIEWDGTKWKVVQHFPHAEGWDPVQKKYTTPI